MLEKMANKFSSLDYNKKCTVIICTLLGLLAIIMLISLIGIADNDMSFTERLESITDSEWTMDIEPVYEGSGYGSVYYAYDEITYTCEDGSEIIVEYHEDNDGDTYYYVDSVYLVGETAEHETAIENILTAENLDM